MFNNIYTWIEQDNLKWEDLFFAINYKNRLNTSPFPFSKGECYCKLRKEDTYVQFLLRSREINFSITKKKEIELNQAFIGYIY